ncbi:MAG: DUF502 domain-containing protein [Gammaproteobacteria bacterium]|nr:DUF502 domain-containing protein [Gammaproteobacteria bacterium]MBD3776020.1 DUF502 domain-containing protein [Thiotrichales bacterium]
MFGFIGRNMLTGLFTVLPVALTLYLFYWLAVTAESLLGGLIRQVVPGQFYWPGMGVIAGLLVLFAIGVLMHAYVVRLIFGKFEGLFERLPGVKPIYRAMRDFFDYFRPQKEQEFSQVVAVTFGDSGMKLIGFITRADADKLPEGFNDNESVLVYLPLSYMIGGYTVLVPQTAVTRLDMTMDEAMRFTLTAGLASTEDKKQAAKRNR